jgi:hypothetical protein
MKQAIGVIGLCGLASSALGQNFYLSMEPSEVNVHTGFGDVTISVEVYGDADVGDYLLGGSFGIESNHAGIIDMQWNPAAWSAFNIDNGFAGNGNYNSVFFGQLLTGGPFPPDSRSVLGSVIGTFEVTFAEGSLGHVDMEFVEGDPFTLSTVGWPVLNEYQSNNGTLHLSGLSINLVPAPGTGALLAIAGLATTRRRR